MSKGVAATRKIIWQYYCVEMTIIPYSRTQVNFDFHKLCCGWRCWSSWSFHEHCHSHEYFPLYRLHDTCSVLSVGILGQATWSHGTLALRKCLSLHLQVSLSFPSQSPWRKQQVSQSGEEETRGRWSGRVVGKRILEGTGRGSGIDEDEEIRR